MSAKYLTCNPTCEGKYPVISLQYVLCAMTKDCKLNKIHGIAWLSLYFISINDQKFVGEKRSCEGDGGSNFPALAPGRKANE